MTELTFEQRVKRRASKKNNELRRSMPLFAEALQPDGAMADWLTSIDKAAADLETLQKRVDKFFDELKIANAQQEKLETKLRNQAISDKTPDEITFLDSRRSIYPDNPSYGTGFWKRVLSQHDWIEQEQERMAKLRRKGEAWRATLKQSV